MVQESHAASINVKSGPQAPPPPPPARPFAEIDEVNAGSPAAAAGLALGDRILKLGDIDAAVISAQVRVSASSRRCAREILAEERGEIEETEPESERARTVR